MGDDVEAELAALLREGALSRAATRALEAYGPELFGYLVRVVGNEPDAREVLSEVAKDLWLGLPKFGLRCSVRTWLYVLGRHALARFRRAPWNQERRRTGDERLDALVAYVRTPTPPWMQTDVKDQVRALQESLAAEDRSLLVLRIDRHLEWKEIARITLGSEAPDAADLVRESDRLKKRFQLLKEELRRRAREAGLVREDP